ncbi:hypothetical protein T265_00244 [Opisthorchis viverrini]|uniref:Uncharacterized protein n=1 Tax=Opisthorchis viverrini TaxID=6198 RepID=A0A075AD90_OPIVI|nr:hypothetical protein T265_00244 [Opisthorchis viverrini]KER34065.1 hypothetical protein T265_00244 [Opisthorchis viverrini]
MESYPKLFLGFCSHFKFISKIRKTNSTVLTVKQLFPKHSKIYDGKTISLLSESVEAIEKFTDFLVIERVVIEWILVPENYATEHPNLKSLQMYAVDAQGKSGSGVRSVPLASINLIDGLDWRFSPSDFLETQLDTREPRTSALFLKTCPKFFLDCANGVASFICRVEDSSVTANTFE